MRPVNLIPPEKRRGDRRPVAHRRAALRDRRRRSRCAVVVVTCMVMTGKQINDREAEVASLEAAARPRRRLAPTRCAPTPSSPRMQDARDATVTSLAQSRFDWERVLRELARVIPEDVWLTGLTGTVNPRSSSQKVAEVEPRADRSRARRSIDRMRPQPGGRRRLRRRARATSTASPGSASPRSERPSPGTPAAAPGDQRTAAPGLHRPVRDRRRLRRGRRSVPRPGESAAPVATTASDPARPTRRRRHRPGRRRRPGRRSSRRATRPPSRPARPATRPICSGRWLTP